MAKIVLINPCPGVAHGINEANLDNYDAELCSTTLFSMGEKLLTYLDIAKRR